MEESISQDEAMNKLYGQYLVDLVINQDHIAQNFLKFMLTVESALVVAFAFFLRLGPGQISGQELSHLRSLAIWLIPVMGIIVAITLTVIIIYERKFQSLYVDKFNRLPGHCDHVFPKDHPYKSPANKMHLGRVDIAVIVLGILTVLAWGFFLWAVYTG